MYKSPIEVIYKDVQHRLEENIYKTVMDICIKVDRDELIEALEYDRQQYEKGYEDAKAEMLADGYILPVRCKDCIYGDWVGPGLVYCNKGFIAGSFCEEDFFCRFGERKEKTDE